MISEPALRWRSPFRPVGQPPTTAAGAGHITVASGTATLSGITTIRALQARPSLIDMASCPSGHYFTVTYSGVTAPAPTGSPYTFTTQTDIGAGGEGLVDTIAALSRRHGRSSHAYRFRRRSHPGQQDLRWHHHRHACHRLPTLVGVIGADSVSLVTGSATGTFDDKNVGTAKTVIIAGLTLTGANAGNYLLTQPTRMADITIRPITVTAVTDTKTYDGTDSSIGVPGLSGSTPLAPGDTAPAWTQTFDNRNVGTGKTLTPAGTVVDGNNGLNYAYTCNPVTTGIITPAPLTAAADPPHEDLWCG